MSAHFLLLTTFSQTATGGNPAAVVFTDLDQSQETLKNIAQNLNQPVTAFVSANPITPSLNLPKSVAFSVRWYASSRDEIPLCGHGTLAAAKAIFDRTDVVPDTEVVELHTFDRGVATALKRSDGLLEIDLPAGETHMVSPEEFTRLSNMLNEASGRELTVEHIAIGGKGFEDLIVYVLDEKEDLKNLPINAQLLRKSGFKINIFTTIQSNAALSERFNSRMFAPGIVPGDEDHVCGSAHCLTVPYWYKRLEIDPTSKVTARQVSARGGVLNVGWNQETKRVTLAGELTLLGEGKLKLA